MNFTELKRFAMIFTHFWILNESNWTELFAGNRNTIQQWAMILSCVGTFQINTNFITNYAKLEFSSSGQGYYEHAYRAILEVYQIQIPQTNAHK